MEGVRAKTRKEEYKREQPGYVLLRGEAKGGGPKGGTDRSVLLHLVVATQLTRSPRRAQKEGARAKGESVAAHLQAAARKRFCAWMSVRVNNAKEKGKREWDGEQSSC